MNFRFKALTQLRQPDELDAPVVLAAPRGWVAIIALTVVTAGAIAWAVFGRLPQTVTASGLITRPQGTVQVQSLYTGMVTSVHPGVGGHVTAGQALAVVRDPGGARHTITRPFGGQVMSVGVADGQVISTGSPVATIERSAGSGGQVVALLFVPAGQAAGLTPGEPVGLSVASAPASAFGLLRGRVLSVSQYPLTSAAVRALLGGTAPPGMFGAGPAAQHDTESQQNDRRTASGYAWTTVAGPPQPLPAQVPATGTVSLGVTAPISLLFSR